MNYPINQPITGVHFTSFPFLRMVSDIGFATLMNPWLRRRHCAMHVEVCYVLFSRDPYSNQPYVSQLTPIQVLESIPHLECKLKVRVRKTDFYQRCSYVSRWFTKLSAKCFVVEIYHNLVGRLFWWIVFKKTQISTDVFLPFDDCLSFLLVFVPRELENTQYSSALFVFAPVIEWAERISYTPERFVYIYIY